MSAIVFAENDFSETYLAVLLDAIFGDDTFKAQLLEDLAQTVGPCDSNSDSFKAVFSEIDNFVLDRIRQDQGQFRYDAFDMRIEWLSYRGGMAATAGAYGVTNKENPYAVWWPNPESYPDQYLDGLLPYARRLGVIDKETAIGSAGSCFAWEIAASLQARGFNCIVTELEVVPGEGMTTAESKLGDPLRSSANWGLLFNTPSFRQIAEKAFGERDLPRIVVPFSTNLPNGESRTLYSDPFREGVNFYSVDAYEANYPKHVEATRQAFLRSEYFVVTLGLNECWEYMPDGSVISRNPQQANLRSLLRPRVLSVDENIDNIQRLFDIVRVHNPDFKLIISVSPVPFLATWQGSDTHVVTANTHSKAVLRVAAEELARRNDGIFYFPSFEMVTVCTANPWERDLRHVTREAVGRVMDLFDTIFVSDDAAKESMDPVQNDQPSIQSVAV